MKKDEKATIGISLTVHLSVGGDIYVRRTFAEFDKSKTLLDIAIWANRYIGVYDGLSILSRKIEVQTGIF